MARGKSKTAEASALATVTLPGEAELLGKLLDDAVVELNRIYVIKGLETAKAVGEYVLDKFFDGDPANFRTRGNGHVTFRQLGDRDDLHMGWQFIWNAVAVVEQLRKLPEHIAEKLPLSHHKLLLGVKDDAVRLQLAEEAVRGGLSKRTLAEQVKAARTQDPAGSKAGRPPLPAFAKAFSALRKVAETASSEVISKASFEHFSHEQTRKLLVEFDTYLADLTAVAQELRRQIVD